MRHADPASETCSLVQASSELVSRCAVVSPDPVCHMHMLMGSTYTVRTQRNVAQTSTNVEIGASAHLTILPIRHMLEPRCNEMIMHDSWPWDTQNSRDIITVCCVSHHAQPCTAMRAPTIVTSTNAGFVRVRMRRPSCWVLRAPDCAAACA